MQNGDKIEYKGLKTEHLGSYQWHPGTYVAPHPYDAKMCIILSELGVILVKSKENVRIPPKKKVKKMGYVFVVNDITTGVVGCTNVRLDKESLRTDFPYHVQANLPIAKVTWEVEE